MSQRPILLAVVFSLCGTVRSAAEDRVFSGPQVGEKLPAFKVRGVFEPNAGKELDFVSAAAGKPIVLVFIHDVNRPSLRMTKLLTYYATGLATQGLSTGVVWLTDDVAEAETTVKKLGRISSPADRALSRAAPVGLSLDGREGPGSYGLNRNVTLTVLVGDKGKVTANFALIQSSIAVDMPGIVAEIAKVCGAPPASLDDLLFVSPNSFHDQMLSLLERSAAPEEVDQAATAIDRLLKDDPAARKELRRVLQNALNKGILDQQGTPRAREHLQRWHQELSPAPPVPDRVFSGPQVGEKLPAFKVRGVFEPNAGKELDFVSAAAGKPIVLVFIHDVNRPSLRMTKLLTYYTAGLASQGVHTGVVWLTDDITESETTLKKRCRELTREAPTGISLDGLEGPGSYGLNRNVTLTILIGHEGRVTENFALIQPGIATDLPKILQAIAKANNSAVASLDDLLFVSSNTFLGSVLFLIDRSATPQEVDQTAESIEQVLKKDQKSREELRRVIQNAAEKELLDQHGTPRAREHLRRWQRELAQPSLQSVK